MKYRDFTIEESLGGYIVYYHGDEIYFRSKIEAKEFIDSLYED